MTFTMRTSIAVAVYIFGALSASTAWADNHISASVEAISNKQSPLDSIRTTIDEVVKIVEALPGESNLKPRRDKLYDAINPHFDFNEMAKRSLGTYWNEITPDEQSEFVKIFSRLLSKTYLQRIEGIKRGMVKFKGEEIDASKASVKTTVENKGDVFPIDYKLLQQDGSWKVYDVIIENIGLVANYRNEFAGIIRKEKFAGLMTRLKSKES